VRIRGFSKLAIFTKRTEKGRNWMKRHVLFIVSAALVAGLLASCGGQPDTGHVGPVGTQGQVGPEGDVGPQRIEGTPPANLTVIEDANAIVTKEYAFDGFTRVEISDGFDVDIKRGEDFRVSTRFEETAVPYIRIGQDGDTFKIMLEPDRAYNMVDITLDVEITMPQLEEIVLADGAGATVTGFDDFGSEVDFLSELHRE
jgi:hypothetical protein